MGAWLVAGNDDVLLNVPKEIAYNFQELNVLAKGRAWKTSFYAKVRMMQFITPALRT